MSKKKLNILMLEDDPLDAELNKQQLLQLDGYQCVFNLTTNKHDYLQALENTNPDIILCDYNLPQYTGLQALNDLNDRKKLIPFIFVTGAMNEETAADAIKSGAWDYVVKDRLFRLPLAVRSVLALKEEKKAAALAEDRLLRLITAIDQSSTQIIVFDKNGNVEYVNRQFIELSGLNSNNIVGKNVFFETGNSFDIGLNKQIIDHIKNGNVFKGELCTQKNNGKNIWELVSVTPIKNNNNQTQNYVVVKEDITTRKAMELEIIAARDKAEKSDKLKDAFLQNMSHEIRTPLNAIVGFSDLLNEAAGLTVDKIKHYSSIICNSSNQLLSIVNDILTISSIQTGHEIVRQSPVDIQKILVHLFHVLLPVAQAKKIQFRFDNIDSPAFTIFTDETKLNQIAVNLVNNAIKYTNTGTVNFGYVVDNNNLKIYVKDTGIGISAEHIELIFDRFYQVAAGNISENSGTGLGLSISLSFAKLLGGSITVESEVGKGSLFTLLLPVKTEKLSF